MSSAATSSMETVTDVPKLTARSIIAGFVLAVVLCGVNSYLTLSFGVIEEGPTIAALFFFAVFFLSRTDHYPLRRGLRLGLSGNRRHQEAGAARR